MTNNARAALMRLRNWAERTEKACDACPVHIDGDDLRHFINNELAALPAEEPAASAGHPSLVQCQFDDPEIVVHLTDAVDGLDQRLREIEKKVETLVRQQMPQ